MSNISIDKVKEIADIARLAITEEEAAKLTEEFTVIIENAGKLNELDTEDVKPTTHGLDIMNVMREDIPGKGLTQEEIVKNAPDHLYGQIKVPSIIE